MLCPKFGKIISFTDHIHAIMKLNCPSPCSNVTGSESGGLPVALMQKCEMITPIVLFHKINKNKCTTDAWTSNCTCSTLEKSVEVHQHLALNLEQHFLHHPR